MGISLKKFTILQKIFIGSIIFALPVIILLFYMVAGFNRDISFARLELGGNKLLMRLESIAELIPEHQLMTRMYIEGNTDLEDKINITGNEIENQFILLLKDFNNDKTLEKALRIAPKNLKDAGINEGHISDIYKRWQKLRSDWKNNITTSNDDIHNDVILMPIRTLIKRIGNTSNMVLDPNLDTTYLMEVGLVAVPKTQERVSSFVLFVESVIFKGFLSKEDKVKFSVFAAILEEDMERISRSVETAIKENNNNEVVRSTLNVSLPHLLDEYKSSIIPFLFITQRFVNDPDFRISAVDAYTSAKKILDAGTKLREVAMMELHNLLDKRYKTYVNKRFTALFLSLGMLFLATVVFIVISRGISKSLGKVVDIAGKIARGDLRKAMEDLEKTGRSDIYMNNKADEKLENQKNEIYRLFHAITVMTSSLYSLIIQVGKSGIQMSTSSAKIAVSARELEATVAEQASSISEVSATSNEISATSQEFAKTMNKVSRMASEAAEMASVSMSSLSNINSTMKKLLDDTTESSEKLKVVNEKMDNITQVITTITRVANQINLLSLNAAIEAEKAGAYGIGFSVVAREIRRLADQTAVSALDIETIIMETREAVKDGSVAVETYTNQTRISTEKIAEISIDLLRAIEYTQELVPQFESVNQGMQMQSQSASQISESMGYLNQAAGQTRDSLVEFRSVTEQLNSAAKDLEREVARFTINSEA